VDLVSYKNKVICEGVRVGKETMLLHGVGGAKLSGLNSPGETCGCP
jgi:hypothetical protein